MNEVQKKVLIAIAAIILGMLLYPPFQTIHPRIGGSLYGYDWIQHQPRIHHCGYGVTSYVMAWRTSHWRAGISGAEEMMSPRVVSLVWKKEEPFRCNAVDVGNNVLMTKYQGSGRNGT